MLVFAVLFALRREGGGGGWGGGCFCSFVSLAFLIHMYVFPFLKPPCLFVSSLTHTYFLFLFLFRRAAISLESLPREMQELALLDDLLFLLVGVEGKYIRVRPRDAAHGSVGFTTDAELDTSFSEMISRIIVACSHYSAIANYIDTSSDFLSGRVNQALSAAMRTLLKDYYVLVAQMEHQFKLGSLTLQRMWFYLQPCLHTLEVVAAVARQISVGNCRGAAVLTLLHERVLACLGDASEETLVQRLAEAAAEPYMLMLARWVHRGIVDDPCCEFMVEEDTSVGLDMSYNDAYWEKHYVLVAERVPAFLRPCAEQALLAGKYLNVIRQSGRVLPNVMSEALPYSMRERVYGEHVDTALKYASRLLLDLLMGELQLRPRLRAMKRYFLMSQGDFFVHLTDMAREELEKNLVDIQSERMTALIELAQRTSTAAADPFKDDLKCTFAQHNLVTELFRIMNVSHDYNGVERPDDFVDAETLKLDVEPGGAGAVVTGYEAFTLNYTVRWPTLLVLNGRALKKYQLLFRHIFHVATVRNALAETWAEAQGARSSLHPPTWLTMAYELRHRMLHFVTNLQHYTSYEVVEPNWTQLEKQLGAAKAIDDVLRDHGDFLDTCLRECLLTNPFLLKTVSKLLSVCEIFASYMKRFVNSLVLGESDASRDDTPYEKTVSRFRENFAGLMDRLLASLSERAVAGIDQHTTGLVTRLDFNGFYTQPKEHRTFSALS